MPYLIISASDTVQITTEHLIPRLLADGTYTVGTEVLSDATHAAAWPVLLNCPQVELDVLVFPHDEDQVGANV
jgi:hypothetical protein